MNIKTVSKFHLSVATNSTGPFAYNVCGVMQQRVYPTLPYAVQECWWTQEATGRSLEQNIIDTAINEWRKHLRACARTMGRYFEYLL